MARVPSGGQSVDVLDRPWLWLNSRKSWNFPTGATDEDRRSVISRPSPTPSRPPVHERPVAVELETCAALVNCRVASEKRRDEPRDCVEEPGDGYQRNDGDRERDGEQERHR